MNIQTDIKEMLSEMDEETKIYEERQKKKELTYYEKKTKIQFLFIDKEGYTNRQRDEKIKLENEIEFLIDELFKPLKEEISKRGFYFFSFTDYKKSQIIICQDRFTRFKEPDYEIRIVNFKIKRIRGTEDFSQDFEEVIKRTRDFLES